MVMIRKATQADVPQVVDALTAAFIHDPVFGYIIPKPEKRPRGIRTFFQQQVDWVYLPKGNVYVTEDGMGAMTWAPPDKWQSPFSVVLRGGPNMIRASGIRHVPTMLSALNLIERQHKTMDEPHWYLAFIGVQPSHQGKGYGGALLSHKLGEVDPEGRPSYLEASTSRNRLLYHRHGFEDVEEIRLPKDGPPMWRMWRKAR